MSESIDRVKNYLTAAQVTAFQKRAAASCSKGRGFVAAIIAQVPGQRISWSTNTMRFDKPAHRDSFSRVVHDFAPDYLRWMVIPEEIRNRFWSLPARLGSRVYP